ncbi:MerR family transcriptional regulator [bacterium SCGC AG-212-C10]|nr:MerR family transcriptional regulator [bacterium SCGC AG-212-C10]OAI40773.1 MerR family transcriptional regulator [bacterium SCGC AG-212-C10]
MTLYDTIGQGYTTTRRPDPRIAAQIERALGDAETILNVGAGAGSYEPLGRSVVAVEPSRVMIAQRPAGAGPAIRGYADALPFRDNTFDAATAFLSDHHWPDRAAGLRELRRVARRVVVFQWDEGAGQDFWLSRDYLPGFDRLNASSDGMYGHGRIPNLAALADLLGGGAIEVVPIPWDCRDGFWSAYWRRPEAYLDPVVRNGISVFARLSESEVSDGMARLEADLASGYWAERNAEILALDEIDLGYRLVISN